MTKAHAPVSDMLVTVKSREVQRGTLAEMRGDARSTIRHFLAAAHLELVLSNEYAEVGHIDLAIRSRISGASCFWRGRQKEQAVSILDSLAHENPDETTSVVSVRDDLNRNYPL